MITLDSFTQRERELLICLLRCIGSDALATVFDSQDAMIADNAKAKMIVLLEDIILKAAPDPGVPRLDCPERMLR